MPQLTTEADTATDIIAQVVAESAKAHRRGVHISRLEVKELPGGSYRAVMAFEKGPLVAA